MGKEKGITGGRRREGRTRNDRRGEKRREGGEKLEREEI